MYPKLMPVAPLRWLHNCGWLVIQLYRTVLGKIVILMEVLCTIGSENLECNCLPSPINTKQCGLSGSCDRIQGRSVNLSSDEVISGHEAATLPREDCLYRSGSAFVSSSKQEPGQCVNGLASYDTPQKGAPSHPQGRARPSLGSPSGELVTLEEFLQESNNLSPPTVRKTKCLLQSLFNCLILVL